MISTRNAPERANDGHQAVTRAADSHVVPKPVPDSQAKDPRRYQLDQMKRRYSPQQSTLQDGTTNLTFQLKPSDPDFPFELDHLECEVQVPASYPDRPPRLRVKNKDIPRGFAVNIEVGWDRLVNKNQDQTLLALTNALDKNLEAFLSEQKSETVTLLSFKDTRHLDHAATVLGEAPPPKAETPPPPKPAPAPVPTRPYVPEESYTREQTAAARVRRAQEVRQLESRMSRMPHYQKSTDGVIYTLPLEPKRRAELPPELQQVQSAQLIIPLLYPLQSLRVLLNNVESEDAEALEELFAEKAAQQKQMSLTSHLNYLAQNMHVMARNVAAAAEAAKQKKAETASHRADEPDDGGAGVKETPLPPPPPPRRTAGDDERSHVHFIPRPPEWSFGNDSGESESESEGEDEEEDDEDESWDDDGGSDDEGGATVGDLSSAATQQAERGTALSFPAVELRGVELLQVAVLNLSVRCARCRMLNDATGLRPGVERAGSCRKCGAAFATRFRAELVHRNSARAGFVDVSGCAVADMLPSTFVPTCARCSTAGQGLVSTRAEAVTNVCRECHARFTFAIREVKLLAITRDGGGDTALAAAAAAAASSSAAGRRQQQQHPERLAGVRAGEPLPGHGACAHYRRSYRWFRFGCCGRAYACDRCHDAAEDHALAEAEGGARAARMVCGWCGREQRYAPEACGFCGRSVIGRRGSGFWEGGRGTRDKLRMSRKDKRKFRRVGGGEARRARKGEV
ncbi:hypothetical protein GGS23DRAFT_556297 [Durotheca rogersii]|uniref:uncharacterized protein n=1 Tax=Durotheca rogersii TaxID=419775 RepID=UPI00221EB3AA|nr:uncharacterized protein GGS23DRAFT_556297 [Durotheca rogersii]KAI5866268.1 hypothetical protein GGS23DRAFT_556297 [Durotheca rogersii]